MSLYYPPLSINSTKEIFRLNLDGIKKRFEKRHRKVTVQDSEIGTFISDYWQNKPHARWNGRQIRNSCQTALALAEFEAQGGSHKAVIDPDAVVDLQLKHFQRVADAYLGFMTYLKEVYGTDAGQRAKDRYLRADVTSADKGMPLRMRNYSRASEGLYQPGAHEQASPNFVQPQQYGIPPLQANASGVSPAGYAQQQSQQYIGGPQQGSQYGPGPQYSPAGSGPTHNLPQHDNQRSQPWQSAQATTHQNPNLQGFWTNAGSSNVQQGPSMTPNMPSLSLGQNQTGGHPPTGIMGGGLGMPYRDPTQNNPADQHWSSRPKE